ncbi:pyridoxamine 5'-phosphate oxidase family protein [Streptomyces sp. NPDC002120]|uniref:pyridoxamine 5'-phosphate oxidase family protein n=1 Tax=Streptomyces sp. NPDC002120 TaxID=3364631 RepID=UPI0036ABB45F
MTVLDSAPHDVLDAYRTCEFVTLGRNGAPLVWPTAVVRREDGTLLLTTSLAFAQKALNVRHDGRVALLFSDPTGSGMDRAPQVFVSGRAHCPDTIMTSPEGAEEYWRRLFERQPHSRSYLKHPMRPMMSWYYLRLLITVKPERVSVRPSLQELLQEQAPAPAPATTAQTLPGAGAGTPRAAWSSSTWSTSASSTWTATQTTLATFCRPSRSSSPARPCPATWRSPRSPTPPQASTTQPPSASPAPPPSPTRSPN